MAAAPNRRVWLGDIAEATNVFAILIAMLFIPQLRSVGPALAYAFMLLYALTQRRRATTTLAHRWLLLLIPGLALLSTLWSDYPGVTLKHAAELTLTATGALLLSGSRRPTSVLIGAWAAFNAYLAIAFVLGHSVAVGSLTGASETAFTGLNEGKNYLGMTAALGALMSLFLLAWSLRKALPVALVAAPALAFDLMLVYLSKSAGAEIAMALAAASFLAFASLAVFRLRGRIIACGALVSGLTAGGMFGYAFANSVTDAALDLFHKDPTLTGRSYLWYRAAGFIQEHPWLGRGYQAFWVHGNLDAEGLWQYAQLTNRSGFNFHNTLIELVIHFGWIGAVAIIAIFVVAAARLLWRAIRAPSLATALWVAVVTFHVARMPYESLIPDSVDFSTLLMMTALGFGFASMAGAARPVRRRMRAPGAAAAYPARRAAI